MQDDIKSTDSLQAASDRLDRALARLEAGLMDMGERAGRVEALIAERRTLAGERNRLSSEHERLLRRNEQLDESAALVSRRLVDAMETVKSVLAK